MDGLELLAQIYTDVQRLQDKLPVDVGPVLDALDRLCANARISKTDLPIAE